MTVASLRMLFFALQAVDILATILAIRLGGSQLGAFIGVLALKAVVALTTFEFFELQSETLISSGNLAYLGMLTWDGYVIYSLVGRP